MGAEGEWPGHGVLKWDTSEVPFKSTQILYSARPRRPLEVCAVPGNRCAQDERILKNQSEHRSPDLQEALRMILFEGQRLERVG